ncbi:MAG TPA: ELWxxDGT repeat protein, partial [Burkholderiaceae bacterium]|nr:ELWxxDGT repeat protein [Burkholderiaceae bacterium]
MLLCRAIAAVAAVAACAAVHGAVEDAPPREVLDEQRAALAFVAPVGLSVLGDKLLFSAFHGQRGQELWASDGTPQGTAIVKDIRPGFQGSFPSGHVLFGGALYFAADDGESGVELWKSDGTAAGTVRVADIASGARGSMANSMTRWG